MKHSASSLIDEIGSNVLKDQLGLTDRNLRHIKSTGKFAAKFFLQISSIAAARDISVPVSAFTFDLPAKNIGINGRLSKGKVLLTSGDVA